MKRKQRTRSNNVKLKVERAKQQERDLIAKQYNGRTVARKPFSNIVDEPLVAFIPAPEAKVAGASATSRNANGGRKFPRTKRDNFLGELRNPIKVTRADGTAELVNGDAFSKKERKRKVAAAEAYVDRTNETWRLRNIVGNIGDND